MQFHTPVQLNTPPFQLTLSDRFLTVGSCFAQVLGKQLKAAKRAAMVNPFGTLFHPVPLARLLHTETDFERIASQYTIQTKQGWVNYAYPSAFTASTEADLHRQLIEIQQYINIQLPQTTVWVITLGSSFLYRLQTDGFGVANCHKQPTHLFHRELTMVDSLITTLTELFENRRKQQPDLKIILTVSPVRHTRDTLPLNAVSKSTLRLVCHQLTERFPHIVYFPSYEILLDELRDYRFYAPDMIHPSTVAEEYIFERFMDMFFDAELRKAVEDWKKISAALQHRPLQPDSLAHQEFLQKLYAQLQTWANHTDVSTELATVEAQLAKFS